MTQVLPSTNLGAPAPAASSRRRRGTYLPYLLLAPTALLIAGFMLYPMASVFWYSLRHHNVATPTRNRFAGLENYTALLGDPMFWQSLEFSVRWVGTEVALQLVFGLMLALLLNHSMRMQGLIRALAFSPWAVSGVLTTTAWILIFNPFAGITSYLADFGLVPFGSSVLASPVGAFWGSIVAELWKGIPFFAILILAALQGIPQELHEAADVDGATRWKKLWFVTLPQIKGTIFITTLLRTVWEFNNVDLLYTLTGGGPGTSTTTLPLYIVRVAFESRQFGYGAALTVVAFFLLGIFSIIYFRLSRFGQE